MPTKGVYQKKALTIENQIKLLKKRGLTVNDNKEIEYYLNNISYYHLSGYFKPYQKDDDTFLKGKTFDDILKVYFFDRKLRLLFMNALERIEKSFKTQFVYHLFTEYGSHCLTDNKIFKKHKAKIEENLKNSKEPFIKKFREKYSNKYPPLWILAEILSFGDILNIFSRSLENQKKKKIAEYYNLGWKYLYSWLENLREIRNISAHYSRLWNRKITKHLKRSKNYKELKYDNHIFDSIVITAILLKKISPTFDWLGEIEKLIDEYDVNSYKMGFPKNWKKIFKKIKNNKYEYPK